MCVCVHDYNIEIIHPGFKDLSVGYRQGVQWFDTSLYLASHPFFNQRCFIFFYFIKAPFGMWLFLLTEKGINISVQSNYVFSTDLGRGRRRRRKDLCFPF